MSEPAGEPRTGAPEPVDLLVAGAARLVTPTGTRPRGGAELGAVTVLEDASVAVAGGVIRAVGPTAELARRFAPRETLDARGRIVVPGFVDAHTHPVFAATREDEFELRNRGASYVEIAEAGGGILSTVRGVRAASFDALLARLCVHLDRFLELGTTTIEAKSGYGLELAAEAKCLEVIARANAVHPLDLVPTFLGAHAFPPEYAHDRDGYVDLLVEEMLPAIAERGLARYADVFTERHAFDLAQSRRVMRRAKELGFGLRLHVDQLTPLGGAELAAELGAVTADHLECVSEAGIAALAAANVLPVLCPLVALYLRDPHEAPGRRIADAGLPVVISTDFNPGSCFVQSLPEIFSWAALRQGFTAAECLTAATLNAACSLGLGERLGTLEPGKEADLVLLDLPNERHLGYELGRSPVVATVKRGRVVFERSSRVEGCAPETGAGGGAEAGGEIGAARVQ